MYRVEWETSSSVTTPSSRATYSLLWYAAPFSTPTRDLIALGISTNYGTTTSCPTRSARSTVKELKTGAPLCTTFLFLLLLELPTSASAGKVSLWLWYCTVLYCTMRGLEVGWSVGAKVEGNSSRDRMLGGDEVE
jgi:hypothetical protein